MIQYETMLHYKDSTQTPFFMDGVVLSAGYVTEMVLQSHADELHLLPALPGTWETGSLTGIRARGGFTVDIFWKNGELTKAIISADTSGNCSLRYKGKIKTIYIDKAKPLVITGSL
jgi:alpha-L-fucosidase 2